ncbi:murein L,D-transpeptidase catalytic domain-containing protein [Chromobacterium violaceum]|uniref:murein L,D-transpeptidase catalytic domain-containing protein n=1 Tax=Chromobacterium violaceum TaxID=536 RepID=UPI00069CC0D4|nr:murein L,D-transpeptidase catalytic domain family protein [Chromobacterium violaceum]
MGTLEEILLELSRGEGLPDSAVLDMIVVQRSLHPRASLLYWAVVDYGRPSTEGRLFVFDTLEASVQRFLVAHGRGRDADANLLRAGTFSNEPGSDASSLGVCRASETYFGSQGLSLWLDGLERSNSNMRRRNLVMYGSPQVTPQYMAEHGILWRSDGSLAVEPQYSVGLINMLQGGSYINCIRSRR